MFGVEDDELGIGGHAAAVPTSSSSKATRDKDGRTRPKAVGVLERKSNKTVVGGEVVIGKELEATSRYVGTVCGLHYQAGADRAYSLIC
jgi:dynactin-4